MPVLPITMQRQCCSAWCWAAVISSVADGLTTPLGPMPQGQVVTSVLPLAGVDCTGCCPGGCPDLDKTCNLPADIRFALSQMQLGFSRGVPVGNFEFKDIADQIQQNRPVVAEIHYDDPPGGAHAMLIYGCDTTDLLRVGDPATGEILVVPFASFCAPEAYTDKVKRVHGSLACIYLLDGL